MKTNFLFIAFISFIMLSAMPSQSAKTSTITFKTSAVCEDCKERIENKLNYTKGVLFAELNLDTKMLTVKFKPTVISEQQIHDLVASIGYSTDKVKRNEEAFNSLPKCCKGEDVCAPKK